jgi:arabinose-5-phosphate isomerase
VQGDDVVIALSHSGETGELLRLLETIRRIGARLVALTGSPASTLGRAADIVLDCGVGEEACPLNLAPTASTTAALAMGDALAMVLLVEKGFREEDFASLHPGGGIGKRLLRVESLMHTGVAVPAVRTTTPMHAVVAEISAKGLGMTCVLAGDGRLAGVITDGDLRRHMAMADLLSQPASAVMTAGPRTIGRSLLAVEALAMMEQRKITSLVVVDADARVEGVLHLHDLWRTQMF